MMGKLQIIQTDGEDLVVITRSDYEALLARAGDDASEDAMTARIVEATDAKIARGEDVALPAAVWDAIESGEQPTRTAGSGHRSRRFLPAFAGRGSAPSLFGLAPGGVCRAAGVAAGAVRSYRTVSPLPRRYATCRGGLFSVALSLGSRPPDVIRHRTSMEPGLSSPATFRCSPERPSSRLTGIGMGGG